eukprot:COSAG02_NODE_6463_length_3555_cov_2.861979_4_plen_222_part_00
MNVEKRTEIKLTKKEQKKADAAAKKAAQAEAKAEKARIKQEKKAAKAAAKKDKKAASDAPAPTLLPAGGDDIPLPPDGDDIPPPPDDDPDLESLEQLGTLDDLDMGNDLPNPMLLGGEMDAAAAAAAISAESSASKAGAPKGGDEFDMESTSITLGEEKPMTKKEKKAAEKAAKKAEKEAKKKNKKKGKDPTDKVMETEFDSPKPPADETADNPLADAGLK